MNNSISFRDDDKDVLSFEPFKDSNTKAIAKIYDDSAEQTYAVLLETAQLVALKDYLDQRLAEVAGSVDPEFIHRYNTES